MKRIVAVMLVFLLLTGCSGTDDCFDRILTLRDKILKGSGCEFDARITADYADEIHTFEMKCHTDRTGTLSFSVTAPESISQVSGSISETGGNLTFDDQVLAFEMLADGTVTPVSAPWLMMHSLRSGYIHACGEDADGISVQIDDNYKQGALQTELRLNSEGIPTRAEIYYEGRRILSIDVSNFLIV